ncbi:MAG TPA: pyridoxamine 5'-phosphate oxidase family protein [Usitatibacter sp.]|nr:pyridoxamine 5'-phosphate oxidase family protein [Usitatibacter sp.]
MMDFDDVIDSEADLRQVVGAPIPRALAKEITALDEHCRALIGASPFVLIASSDAAGRMDVSPKGDPPGFVHVLDDHTLAIPDRPGNRRADTFTNILQNPGVGLIFLIPGKLETLRVNGRARIVRDAGLRERLSVQGKPPQLALVVTVEQAFIHCGKCMIRSHLWDPASWPRVDDLPSQAQCLVDHGQLRESLAEVQASIEEARVQRLY